MARQAKGTFASYPLGDATSFPDDEEAAVVACEVMLSMCGNPGQETLIGEQMDRFYEWALAILEEEGNHEGSDWEGFAQMVTEDWYGGRADKYQGTDWIWFEGWSRIAEQSGHHDTHDEYGEGEGRNFGA